MCRPSNQFKKLLEAKQKSRKRTAKGTNKVSLVFEERGSFREFLIYRDGELELYDITGRARNQVSLTREEYLIVKALDTRGYKALEPENNA